MKGETMEFKLRMKQDVLRQFNLTEEQFYNISKKMIMRHPFERWIIKRLAQNGQQVVYVRLEYVHWLSEVYFSNKYYLDAEIEFFQKQVLRLENELNISHYEFNYEDMSLIDLREYFGKSKSVIGVAVNRMEKRNNKSYKYIKDGRVMISKEGVKWLNEKYFRKQYLKDLEFYKIELQKRKRKMNGYPEWESF